MATVLHYAQDMEQLTAVGKAELWRISIWRGPRASPQAHPTSTVAAHAQVLSPNAYPHTCAGRKPPSKPSMTDPKKG